MRVRRFSAILLAALILPTLPVAASAAALDSDEFSMKRSALARVGQDYLEWIDLVFHVRDNGALVLGTSHGSVEVLTWDCDDVRLVMRKSAHAESAQDARAILDGFRLRAKSTNDALRLLAGTHPMRGARSVGVRFTVYVPRDCAVEVKTGKGDIEIDARAGRFTASTGDGSVNVSLNPSKT